MLAWQLQYAPVASPAHGMHSAPVWTATPPPESTTPTCRTAASSSAASSSDSASAAPAPPAMRSSALGP